MAEALGWPADLVGFPRLAAPGGRAITINGTEYRARDLRGTDQPSFTVTGTEKPVATFGHNSARPDGLQSVCRVCH